MNGSKAAGVATPANAAIVEVTARIERGEFAPAPSNFALAVALAKSS